MTMEVWSVGMLFVESLLMIIEHNNDIQFPASCGWEKGSIIAQSTIGVVSYLIGQCVVTKFMDTHMVCIYMYMYKCTQVYTALWAN